MSKFVYYCISQGKITEGDNLKKDILYDDIKVSM